MSQPQLHAQWLSVAVIRVTADEPFGPDQLILWEGRLPDYRDGEALDPAQLTNASAQRYQYPDIPYVYAAGEAEPVHIPCPILAEGGGSCYCLGRCREPAPAEWARDPRYRPDR